MSESTEAGIQALHQDESISLSRRSFLGFSLVGSILSLVMMGVGALLKYLKPITTGRFGGKVLAGRVEEFDIDTVSYVLSGRFYISRTENGLLAIYQGCTHLGCAVPWDEEEALFHCPCHGSRFNQVGEVIGGPAPRPMDIFPAEIQDGGIIVDTGSPIQRSEFRSDQLVQT
jgi:cytochrome b6-f complex iron-sulfur subunit